MDKITRLGSRPSRAVLPHASSSGGHDTFRFLGPREQLTDIVPTRTSEVFVHLQWRQCVSCLFLGVFNGIVAGVPEPECRAGAGLFPGLQTGAVNNATVSCEIWRRFRCVPAFSQSAGHPRLVRGLLFPIIAATLPTRRAIEVATKHTVSVCFWGKQCFLGPCDRFSYFAQTCLMCAARRHSSAP